MDATILDPVSPSRDRKIADFRTLGMRDILMLGHYVYSRAHKEVPQHSHGNVFEFCLHDEGIQPFLIEDKEYLLKGGDVLIVRPFETHSSGSNPENRGKLYWFQIKVPDVSEGFLNLNPDESRSLFDALAALPSRHFNGGSHLKTYLIKILEIFEGSNDLKKIELKIWSLHFLMEVINGSRNYSEKDISPLMSGILDYINENLSDKILSLSELSHISGLGLSHFKRRFKTEVGISPGNYIIHQKIEKAKNLLRETRNSITEIAIDVGFSSSQYFATAFMKYTGRTPTSFRVGNHSLRRITLLSKD
jgi:AraC-like DNA-binding protein